MADGPTVKEIFKQRDEKLAACEATAKTERAKVESSLTNGLPLMEFVKGLTSPGANSKSSLLLKIQTDESIC